MYDKLQEKGTEKKKREQRTRNSRKNIELLGKTESSPKKVIDQILSKQECQPPP